MVSREVMLDVASFLDSEQARSLRGIGREGLRAIATAFVGAAYEDLGKRPRFLDGEDARQLLGECLPGRFARKDSLAEHVPAVVDAFVEHLVATEVVTQAWELRAGIAQAMPAFVDLVKSGRNEPRVSGERTRPVVHHADKLGRNDPCFCGSGKKFKKCHGKGS